MPFINVKTNISAEGREESLKSSLGSAITAVPGKSEGWLMVGIQDEYKLWFKGSDAPAAMVEVSLFGGASESALNELTARITDILNADLDIAPDRIYVSYMCTDYWGWSGNLF